MGADDGLSQETARMSSGSLWTDLLGAEIRHVDAAGVPTRVLLAGEGKPVVLLHGRGGHLETWHRNVPALAANHRVIAIDLLGHGGTEPRGDRYTVGELLDHVRATLDALRVGPADLVGQSLGGWVAALLAERDACRVRRLVLVEPAGLLSERERLSDARVRAAYDRGGQAFDKPTEKAVRARFAGLLVKPDLVDPELVAVRMRFYRPEAARAVHRAVRAADNGFWLLRACRLARIGAPVLVIHGATGHLSGSVLATAMESILDGRLLTVSGSRQWPHYEQPDLVNSAIIRFLG
jgi:pimeloyl-ACP methyl ester carboxylesterase